MKVGFTGTRNGMTPAQRATFSQLVLDLKPTTFIHGACTGSDEEAVYIVADLREEGCHIRARPGKNSAGNTDLQSADAVNISDEAAPVETHFARNRKIVADCDVLIATPMHMQRQPHGGTEYTIACGLKAGKRVLIILPDGSLCHTGDQLNDGAK
jgi:hypothetical protein